MSTSIVYCLAIRVTEVLQRSTNGEAGIMTNKLDVGKALEKLRGSGESKSPMTTLDEKTKELDEEIRRLRAERLRLERDNPGPAKRNGEINSSGEALHRSPDSRRLVAGLAVFGASIVALLIWLIG
jgi:hypothetical protein